MTEFLNNWVFGQFEIVFWKMFILCDSQNTKAVIAVCFKTRSKNKNNG